MKKHILSVLSLIAACTISATQYMHVNLPDGKEYDVKIEKTDKVSHVKQGDEVFLKVTRKDNSYSLYPSTGAEVTFDEEISRFDKNLSNWNALQKSIEGCVLDTSKLEILRATGAKEWTIRNELANAESIYNECVRKKRNNEIVLYSDTEKETMQSANKFASNLFSEISKDSEFKNKNVIFSPTSLQFALAMLANGADDDNAYAEITKILGNQDLPLDQLNELYKKRMTNFQFVNPNRIQIGLANAAFLQKDVPFGKNFVQNIEDFYKGAANNVDFTQDSTYKLMDKWANDNTNGMIPKIGLQKNDLYVLVLANALSFQSEWVDKFYKELTKPGEFVTSENEVKQVDKMGKSTSRYAVGNTFQLVSLPFYENFEMNVILPNKDVTPEEALSEFDLNNIPYKHGEINEEGNYVVYIANLSLPKFNIDTKITIDKVMKEMGLNDLFAAEYNNIAQRAAVDGIQQLTHLEIDEEGAKGAAVTIIPMATTGMVEEIYVDFDVNRPFIVTIDNPETHELLFIGLINDPTSK